MTYTVAFSVAPAAQQMRGVRYEIVHDDETTTKDLLEFISGSDDYDIPLGSIVSFDFNERYLYGMAGWWKLEAV